MADINEAERIDAFVASRTQRPLWGEVPPVFWPHSAAEGYRLQREVYERLSQQGQRRIGYKIGCTAPGSQRPFGLHEPIYAGIFEHTRRRTLKEACAMPLVNPSIECEIAFRMARDVDPHEAGSEAALLGAIAETYVACEVVDSRYGVPPPAIGVPALLADDFLHAAFVLGVPAVPDRPDAIRHPRGMIEIDGRLITEPSAGALPPLASLAWLVGKLADNGERLRAGEIVMTGSILDPVPIAARPTHIALAVSGVGSLSDA